MPDSPGCMPQSNIIFLPLNSSMMQERPTSWPAPLEEGKFYISADLKTLLATYSGLICNRSLSSSGTLESLFCCDCAIPY